jgi:glycosyltransferase involved in cell wall biosynthesis
MKKENSVMVLVSVAVITYNMERYLQTLLDSILKQQVNFPYEIIIDDDWSPDHSRELILEYQRRYPDIVKPSLRDTNVGGSRNMYGVMKQCRGKYIAILEGDDFWEDKDKLQYQVDFMESHLEYIGMCCNSWCEHGEVPTYSDLMRNRTAPRVFSYKDFMAREFRDRLPSSTDTWIFQNIFKDGDYPLFYEAHNMIWDQSLILILYGKGKVYANPKVMSHHRSVVKKDGTNYQSKIAQKNCLYGDSQMYQAMEEYMETVLHKECRPFYLVRGNVWVDAIFRAIKSNDKNDKEIAKKIWDDQSRKAMLIGLFLRKSGNIFLRKMRLIK